MGTRAHRVDTRIDSDDRRQIVWSTCSGPGTGGAKSGQAKDWVSSMETPAAGGPDTVDCSEDTRTDTPYGRVPDNIKDIRN